MPESVALPENAHVVVIGLGYVGLPLLVELGRAGFLTTGLDENPGRVRAVAEAHESVCGVSAETLRQSLEDGSLSVTTDPTALSRADAILICVPTPLNEAGAPDLRHITDAADTILQHQRPGQLVVLESTTYPGTAAEVLVPRLTQKGARLGQDVFIASSPERVNPGSESYSMRATPKVIGGATPACLARATSLYERLVDTVVPVGSPDAAEASKLLENTFRAINIAFINEFSIMARHLGIDPHEAISAASTKPFGFMPFQPGPGTGGHCIPIDPLYLSWRLKTKGYEPRFIALADAVNKEMPTYTVKRLESCLEENGKALPDCRILVYGVAYKPNVDDIRESPALEILSTLRARDCRVEFMDPLVSSVDLGDDVLQAVEPETHFGGYDAVLLVTPHRELDLHRLQSQAKLILDTRGAFENRDGLKNVRTL